MHTDSSLGILEDSTRVLGHEIRHFAAVTCQSFKTRETQAEYEARKRAEERRISTTQPQTNQSHGAGSGTVTSSGRRDRQFNLKTVKLHFLGDYVWCIRWFGTTDSYTTQIVSHLMFLLCLFEFILDITY